MILKNSILLLSTCAIKALCLDMDISSTSSVKKGLAKIASGLMDYYSGHDPGNAIGMFENPYYWWESGAAWGSMLDYWYFTDDQTFNSKLYDSLEWQSGDNYDYLPENQTRTEGNDDQGYWGITLMAAAERGFTSPSPGTPSWSQRVENIVRSMNSRWDSENCGGGLRWQIYTWNKGYDYKNTVSNGCFFHLSARLARYNGNKEFAEYAERVWDWLEKTKFIDTSVSGYRILDGASIASGCSEISPEQWTYNAGLLLSGAAYMYDHTKDEKWLDRVKHIWEGSRVFFKDGKYMFEASCQISNRCNNDQRSFKGYFSRFLGLTAKMIPEVKDDIMEKLHSNVPGVLGSCSGGSDGHTCGLDWTQEKWDGFYGLGEQISALEALQNALLLDTKPGPAVWNGNDNQGGSNFPSKKPVSSQQASSSNEQKSPDNQEEQKAPSNQPASNNGEEGADQAQDYSPDQSASNQEQNNPEENRSSDSNQSSQSDKSSNTSSNNKDEPNTAKNDQNQSQSQTQQPENNNSAQAQQPENNQQDGNLNESGSNDGFQPAAGNSTDSANTPAPESIQVPPDSINTPQQNSIATPASTTPAIEYLCSIVYRTVVV